MIARTGAFAIRSLCLVLLGMAALIPSASFAQQRDSLPLQDRKWTYAAVGKAPAKARGLQNPLAADPNGIAAGGKLFEQHCSECHGMKAEGGNRGPSLLRSEVTEASPGSLFWILTNGVIRRGMPDWSKLPEEQRWQIVTFLKSFKAPRTD